MSASAEDLEMAAALRALEEAQGVLRDLIAYYIDRPEKLGARETVKIQLAALRVNRAMARFLQARAAIDRAAT